MFGLFGRKKKVSVKIPASGGELPFQQVWKRKRLPGPGSGNYAFETLGLAAFTPSGPSVATRTPINPLAGGDQLYVMQAVGVDGIPTVAGQVISQPLFDPNQPMAGGNSGTLQNNPHPAGGR